MAAAVVAVQTQAIAEVVQVVSAVVGAGLVLLEAQVATEEEVAEGLQAGLVDLAQFFFSGPRATNHADLQKLQVLPCRD